ncbi:MAG: efflux RND transporter periplasmic adaptor subunit [Anaerolineae bacterium]
MARRVGTAMIILIVVAFGAWQVIRYQQQPDARPLSIAPELELVQPRDDGRLIASGIIEAHQVDVSAEIGGTIVELPVHEGDSVEQGQLLAQMDTAMIDVQMEQAAAAIAVAQAHLALLKAGAREEEIREAERRLELAIANRDAALQAWEDAKAQLANPQELDVQILRARVEVRVAEKQVDAAVAQARAMDEQYAMWGRTVEYLRSGFDITLPGGIPAHVTPGTEKIEQANLQWNLTGQQAWEAWQKVEEAKANLQAAQARLRALEAQREDLIDLQIQVDAAEAAYHAAEAQVEQARAALERLQEGATEEQIAAAEAAVRQSEAALDLLAEQRKKLTIVAPRSGTIVSRPVKRGEVVVPGQPLMRIADLDQVILTAYVPEDRIGWVRLGDQVSVTVDSFPGRVFTGRVTYISDRAEFTPKNVQTQEERINMVFAVKITLDNPDHELKPGMPADADFGTAPTVGQGG